MRVRRGIHGSVAAALLITVAVGCGSDSSDGEADASETPAAAQDSGGVEIGPANEGIDGVVALRIESANHIEGRIDYERQPPAGGSHNPIPLACGFYSTPQATESIVHTLEHGAVWLAYDPDLADDDVELMRGLAAGSPKVIASPFENLPDGATVVASAWARQLIVDDAADARLEAFVERYVDATTAPEAGVPCDQGMGTPER